MAINLTGGQKVSLTKYDPNLKNITLGLGWNFVPRGIGMSFDLDASAFLLTAIGKVSGPKDFIFYGNLTHPSGSVTHKGDRPGSGDKAKIKIDLSLIPSTVVRIAFTVTVYEPEESRQTFGSVHNAYLRIVDEKNNDELVRYNIETTFSNETAVVFGELYRNNGEWKFNAMGDGYSGGLAGLCGKYGVEVG